MNDTILIPNDCEYNILKYDDSFYCLDVGTSIVLKIDKNVKYLLDNHKGESIGMIRDISPIYETPIVNIEAIKQSGIFAPPKKEFLLNRTGVNKITICLTERCNYHCTYCYTNQANHNKRDTDISIKTLNKIICYIDSLDANVIEVNFFGGEPLLRFDLIQYFVSKAKKTDKTITYLITTNASLIDDEVAVFMRDNKIKVIASLDLPKSACDEHRLNQVGSSYDLSTKGIRILNCHLEKGCTINTVITKDNIDIEHIVSTFIDDNLSNRLSTTIATGQSGQDDIELNTILIKEKRVINNILNGLYPITFTYLPLAKIVASLIKRLQKKNRCFAGISMIAIDSKGSIYPCHRFMYNHEFIMGDISKGINPSIIDEYCKNNVDAIPECKDCWARYLCGGPCYHDSYITQKNTTKIHPARCERIKSLTELAIITYGELLEKNKTALISMVTA